MVICLELSGQDERRCLQLFVVCLRDAEASRTGENCNSQGPCIESDSDESRFNVSLMRGGGGGGGGGRQCPWTTTFEEKGEPKRNRTNFQRLGQSRRTPECDAFTGFISVPLAVRRVATWGK